MLREAGDTDRFGIDFSVPMAPLAAQPTTFLPHCPGETGV